MTSDNWQAIAKEAVKQLAEKDAEIVWLRRVAEAARHYTSASTIGVKAQEAFNDLKSALNEGGPHETTR